MIKNKLKKIKYSYKMQLTKDFPFVCVTHHDGRAGCRITSVFCQLNDQAVSPVNQFNQINSYFVRNLIIFLCTTFHPTLKFQVKI